MLASIPSIIDAILIYSRSNEIHKHNLSLHIWEYSLHGAQSRNRRRACVNVWSWWCRMNTWGFETTLYEWALIMVTTWLCVIQQSAIAHRTPPSVRSSVKMRLHTCFIHVSYVFRKCFVHGSRVVSLVSWLSTLPSITTPHLCQLRAPMRLTKLRCFGTQDTCHILLCLTCKAIIKTLYF